MLDAPPPALPDRSAGRARAELRAGDARERRVSGLMAAYFFVVITVFWVLKPLKKALFLRFYADRPFALPALFGGAPLQLEGAQAELLAKVLNIGVAIAAASVFAALSRRRRRERLSALFGVLFAVSFAALARGFTPNSALFTWGFYLFGDLFNMVMVAAFFAHLNDLVSAHVARRSYAFVVLGGVLGGVFGSTVVRAYVSAWSIPTWLTICALCSLLVALLGSLASRAQRRGGDGADPVLGEGLDGVPPVLVAAPVRDGLAGARVVLGSRYLITIAGIVAVYEVVSTVLDFQFSATVSHYLRGPAIGEQLATVFLVTNVVSLCVQLLCTRYVMERLGVRAALSVLPFAVLVVASGFALMPLLWVGSSLSIADNALNYSMNQSARESLYVPADPREKYQAKAFIDIVVQRAAKACGVLLSLGMSVWCKDDLASVRALSLVVVVLAALWLAMARYAGTRFEEMV